MGKVYTYDNILKGFNANGQLSLPSNTVPSSSGVVNTYRGDIELFDFQPDLNTNLRNRDTLFSMHYKTMYENGILTEEDHDKVNTDFDMDNNGNIVP